MTLDELERLEGIFSVYRPDSELCRWRERGRAPSPELTQLLELAAHWFARTGGVFNPSVGRLSERWARAEAEQREPAAGELAQLASSIGSLPYSVRDGTVEQRGDCRSLNFNALAKGFAVDLACAHTWHTCGPGQLVINVGGDLVHRGDGAAEVGVEDPHRPYDNAAPLTTVTISNQAMATSGRARRGWSIGHQWFSHVLDPRTGRPVAHVASASVIAPDAATADAVATMLSVVAPAEGIAFADGLDDVAGFVVDDAGRRWASERWPDDARASAPP